MMEYLNSKPRYETLDGLRGVAALMVVIFHCFETYIPTVGTQIVNHGYLAVDFFFVLSGFVIGYAYDDRWKRMTVPEFFRRRLVRLHPMVIAGTVIGACLFFFGSCEQFPKIASCPLWKFFLCIAMGLLMIPCGPKLDIRGWNETNPLNGPNWTLTYEYVGNILYALIFRRLPTLALALLCICCAFFTLDLTLGWDVFGFFAERRFNVIGGWSLTPDQIYIGFTRLLYPFLCGLLLSRILASRSGETGRSGSPIRLRGGFWLSALALTVIFSVPQINGSDCFADGLYQASAILVLFPLTVLVGAGSRTSDGFSTKACRLLGELSYPLYITHYPLMYLQMAWVEHNAQAPLWQHVALNSAVVVCSVAAAFALSRMYDLPIRRFLTEKWLRH